MYNHNNNEKPVFISYTYGDLSKNDIIKGLKGYLDITNDTDISILSHETFANYNPHPTIDAIKDGFYNKLNSLQGSDNIYLTGSMFSFEAVEATFSVS
eukprot:UN16574